MKSKKQDISRFLILGTLVLFSIALVIPSIVKADDSSRIPKMTLGSGSQTFKIAIDPGTFPPFTSGPFEGIDFEVLKAVCEANSDMKCKVQLREFSECSIDGGVGTALAKGKVDGCVNWVKTAPRIVEGFEFAEPYHRSSAPQLVCVEDLQNLGNCETTHSITENEPFKRNLNGAFVGFVSGFFATPACLNDVYDKNTYDPLEFADLAGLEEQLNIPGGIDYGFWDTTTPLPEGTILAGIEVPSCGSQSSILLYPPSKGRKHKSDALRRAWNCGLALVRHTPTLLDNLLIALELEDELGQPPIDPDEFKFIQDGPLPTVQCLKGNQQDHDD